MPCKLLRSVTAYVLVAILPAVAGCGVLSDSARRPSYPIPGQSIASPSVQHDVLVAATTKAVIGSDRGMTCDTDKVRVIDTRIREGGPVAGSTSGGLLSGSSWSEAWIFDVCGETYAVITRFSRSVFGGTSYEILSFEEVNAASAARGR